jgi:OOP family OmpA-OmpF porin
MFVILYSLKKMRIPGYFPLRIINAILVLVFSYMLIGAAAAQNTVPVNPGKTYKDGHGGTVTLPLGDLSFADEVVSFTRGNPEAVPQQPDSLLPVGTPDFNGMDGGFLTLGCGGSLVLQFKDNALVNIKGPDLYVFEMGKYIEPTDLSVSKDGIHWIVVGKINGAKAAVDIGDSVKAGEIFYFVKLTDLRTECTGSWPGADIDAVAAIGSAKRISLNSTVLFSFNESILKSDAKKALDKIAEDINKDQQFDIVVEGHTDSIGTKSYNQKLSETRAKAVRDYLYSKMKSKQQQLKSVGYADKYPAASNNTPAGQEKNRRVEIILVPKQQ